MNPETTNAERRGLSLRYPLDFLAWLTRAPKPVLWSVITIAGNLLAAAYAWMWVKDANQFHEDAVRVLGAGLQCAGVLAVWWGVVQTRQLFESHGAPKPMREWLSARPDLWRRHHMLQAVSISAGAPIVGRATLTAHGSASMANATIEEQLANLRLAIEGLRQTTADIRAELIAGDEATKAALKTALASETRALADQIEQARRLLVSHATGGINLSFNGAICLFVGVLLGTLPYSWF